MLICQRNRSSKLYKGGYMFELNEECGVAGVFNAKGASSMVRDALFALQHRGQEGTGIISYSSHESVFCTHHGLGLVSDNFQPETLEKLLGSKAIGHVRYSTSGNNSNEEQTKRNLQPFFAETAFGGFALAHNGNLTNTAAIREEMIKCGKIFHSTSDTEVLFHLMAEYHEQGQTQRIIESLKKVKGSYALVMLTKDALIGARDTFGIRPLVLGKAKDGFVLASETCALDILKAEFVREIEPGEIVIITDSGIESTKPFESKPKRFCDFEYIYFARPDSEVAGNSVQDVRIRLGESLARNHPVSNANVVFAVPDSGVPAALGYARASGIRYEPGLVRNHYVGRTFLSPVQATRERKVMLKLNPVSSVIRGKCIVLIDDSIVRGTNMKIVADMLWKAGVKEVHLRISCPQIKHPCFYGIDTPTKGELFANRFNDVEEMRRYLNVTSLAFMSIEELHDVIPCKGLCSSCFAGKYPI